MFTIYFQRTIRVLIVLSAIVLSNQGSSQEAISAQDDALTTDDTSKSSDTFSDPTGYGGKSSVYIEREFELGIDTTAPGALRDVIDGTSNTFRGLTDGTSKPTSSAQGQIKAGVSTDSQTGEASKEARKEAGKGAKQEARRQALNR